MPNVYVINFCFDITLIIISLYYPTEKLHKDWINNHFLEDKIV